MGRIKKYIRKLFYKKITIKPIIDLVQYAPIEGSYAGGSLAESNVLLVSNLKDLNMTDIEECFRKENAVVAAIRTDGGLAADDITEAGEPLLGPFTHIINIVRQTGGNAVLTEDGGYNEDDAMCMIYQWLQAEADLLVKQGGYSTICTVYIKDHSADACIYANSMDMCITGLARVLAGHRIICNGIVASSEVPLMRVMQTAVFLSSKYGQVMAGEVLNLKG